MGLAADFNCCEFEDEEQSCRLGEVFQAPELWSSMLTFGRFSPRNSNFTIAGDAVRTRRGDVNSPFGAAVDFRIAGHLSEIAV